MFETLWQLVRDTDTAYRYGSYQRYLELHNQLTAAIAAYEADGADPCCHECGHVFESIWCCVNHV